MATLPYNLKTSFCAVTGRLNPQACELPITYVVLKEGQQVLSTEGTPNPDWLHLQMEQRIRSIGASILQTVSGSKEEIERAILLFRDWMLNGTIVRIISAGRAGLASSIPANRLAHGGARVYIQEDVLPMLHSIKGGGIIAVSTSGKTPSVLDALRSIREEGGDIQIVGIAKKGQELFQNYCHIFIGIDQDTELPDSLSALADIGEHVISGLLDTMVVTAGKLAGFEDNTWRLGHEDIGMTGPYDTSSKSE